VSAYNPRYTYDTTIDGLCARVLTRLNDTELGCEEERWSKPFIRSVICDAFWALSKLNSTLFSQEVDVKLEPGESCQSLPDDCSGASEFLKVYDKDAKRTIPVINGDYGQIKRNAHYPACTNKRRGRRGGHLHAVTQYQFGRVNSDAREFFISPIPPAGSNLCVKVRCTDINSLFEDGENPQLPDELRPYFAAMMELVMYTALSMDRDSAAQVAMANLHLNSFVQLTNFSYGAALNAVAQAQSNE